LHESAKFEILSHPLTFPAWRNINKIPAWARNILFLALAGILHSSMPEDISDMEKCKILAWARDKMILH
jgi:hypothetical protein